MNLRTPGPTPIPPEVNQAGTAEMIDHRGPEFAAMMERCIVGAKQVFQTQNEVVILTTSGTGAMEAAAVNFVSAGDKVESRTDERTGLPVHSLYGATRKPTPAITRDDGRMLSRRCWESRPPT